MTTTPEKSQQTAPEKSDEVTLTIDGVEVSVAKNTLVIRAAEQIGVQLPRFCDHPLLAPVGACRQCLVMVPDGGNGRPIPKPQASCTLTVADGMVVNTQVTDEKADKAQQATMASLYQSIQGRSGETEFVGYETTSTDARIVAILRDGIEYQELEAKGARFSGDVNDYGYGKVLMLQVPGTDDIQLYEPGHPTAYDL